MRLGNIHFELEAVNILQVRRTPKMREHHREHNKILLTLILLIVKSVKSIAKLSFVTLEYTFSFRNIHEYMDLLVSLDFAEQINQFILTRIA